MSNVDGTKYECAHKEVVDGIAICSLAACDDGNLDNCCGTCGFYEGKDRGLGDTVKRATNALGMRTCGACERRRKQLNKFTERFYREKRDGS